MTLLRSLATVTLAGLTLQCAKASSGGPGAGDASDYSAVSRVESGRARGGHAHRVQHHAPSEREGLDPTPSRGDRQRRPGDHLGRDSIRLYVSGDGALTAPDGERPRHGDGHRAGRNTRPPL